MDFVVGTEFNKANAGRAKSEIEKIIQRNAKYVPNKGAVANMKEFFTKYDFGKELQRITTKTPKQYKGQSVYEVNKNGLGLKKGDKIYLDSLHKNHLEIYNSNRIIVEVRNLDGTLNIEKTRKALLENRVLKK